MALTIKQRKQLNKQIKFHTHEAYVANIKLAEGFELKNFKIFGNVFRPEKMTAIYLTKWIFENRSVFAGKKVLDMGAGSGIQGIVAGLCGAKKVAFSDLSLAASKNCAENIKRFKLKNKAVVFNGDLFEKIKGRFDLIIFNHPFFSDHTIEQLIKLQGEPQRGKLIHRFFKDVPRFLSKRGIIIMPYFHLAGKINNPLIQAQKYGYEVSEKIRMNVKKGVQKGMMSIYEIKC